MNLRNAQIARPVSKVRVNEILGISPLMWGGEEFDPSDHLLDRVDQELMARKSQPSQGSTAL